MSPIAATKPAATVRLTPEIVTDRLGDLAVEPLQVLAQPIKFAQMALDGGPFVLGERLARQPAPPPSAEQIGMRA